MATRTPARTLARAPAGTSTRKPGPAKASLSSAGAQLLLDNQFCFALYSTLTAMNKVYRPVLNELGLTYPQYLALLVLWEQDQASVSQIGERLLLDSATLTPLLKRLEALGLIERKRAQHDERVVIISLTAQGRALRERAKSVPLRALEASGCSVPELKQLRERLVALRGRLLTSAAD
jgi:DNA-binding MarR family transcriptional regulator